MKLQIEEGQMPKSELTESKINDIIRNVVQTMGYHKAA